MTRTATRPGRNHDAAVTDAAKLQAPSTSRKEGTVHAYKNIVLLSHDLDTGRAVADRVGIMAACSGAYLADLMQSGVLDIDPGPESRLLVAEPGDDVAHAELARLVGHFHRMPIRNLLGPFTETYGNRRIFTFYRDALLRLYERGVVVGGDGPVLRFAPKTDWPIDVLESFHTARADIARVIDKDAEPGVASRPILFALHACGVAGAVSDHLGHAKRPAAKRCSRLFARVELTPAERTLKAELLLSKGRAHS